MPYVYDNVARGITRRRLIMSGPTGSTIDEKKINWESFRVFYFVAKNESITGAAKELFISQPAVSRTISLLESELGCRLFFRKPRGVELTPEGSVLFTHIEKAHNEIQEGRRSLRSLLDLDRGELRLAASDTALRYYILGHIAKFRALYPAVSVGVLTYPTSGALAALASGKVDIAIVASPLLESDKLDCRIIKNIQYIFAASSSYELPPHEKTMSVRELTNEDFICMSEGTSTRQHLADFFESNGMRLDAKYSLPENDLILDFIKEGLGIGIITANAAEKSLRDGSIVQIPVREKIPPVSIIIATKKNGMTRIAERFIDAIL